MNGFSDSSHAASTFKVLETKTHPTKILNQLNQLRMTGQFTDAVVIVDQEELKCHRCVLSASSPYFHATFSSNFQEAESSQVTLHDISPWIMRRILDYIYTGKIEISIDNAQDYLRAGHLLQYADIVDACCQLLTEHLHFMNSLGVREFAHLYDCTKLEKAAFSYSLEHFIEIIERSEELIHLPLQSLVLYLSNDHIEVDKEFTLWRAIKKWILYDSESRGNNMLNLVSCLRLEVLTAYDLEALKKDKLISSNAACLKLLDNVSRSSQDKKSSGDSHHKNGCHGSSSLESINSYKKGPRPSTLPQKALILLGSNTSCKLLSNVLAYIPHKNRWLELPSLPEKIVEASVTSSNEAIFVCGGIVNNVLSNKVWKYCFKEKKWSREASMLFARAHHCSTIMNGILYIIGGVTVSDNKDNTHNGMSATDIHAFNIDSQKWQKVGESRMSKEDAVLLAFNNTLYELGGKCDGYYVNTMETFNIEPETGTLTSTGEHYILPGTGSPGPIKAVLLDSNLIYIYWEKTGEMVSLDTKERRFSTLRLEKFSSSVTLTILDSIVYIFPREDKPERQAVMYNLESGESLKLSIPKDYIFHVCMQALM